MAVAQGNHRLALGVGRLEVAQHARLDPFFDEAFASPLPQRKRSPRAPH